MKILKKIKAIHTVDKFLIIIMLILLLQSVAALFLHRDLITQSNNIDIIVRTSSASIFGYFLSENFIKPDTSTKNENIISISSDEILPPNENINSSKNIQITIIALISIISLLILLVIRNFFTVSSENIATLSQLRDFVSSGIGFLVGCKKNS